MACFCICIWSPGFCDRSRQGSALPHPAVCWLWPWRNGRYGRYGRVLQVDASGSGGEVIQELQLRSLSIHSPRRGTLGAFLGQFKARAGKSRRLHTPPPRLWHKPSRAAPLPVSAGSSGQLAPGRGPLNLPPCMQKVQPFVERNRGSQTAESPKSGTWNVLSKFCYLG